MELFSPKVLETLVEQTPAIVAIVIVVIVFMRYLKYNGNHRESERAAFLDHLNRRDDLLVSIGNECHQVQRESIKTMQDCHTALGQNNEVIRQNTQLVRSLLENKSIKKDRENAA